MKPIDLTTLTSIDHLPKDHTTSFSHVVSKVSIPGSTGTWYCKEIKTPHEARTEVLAQEFFRLIIPQQPITRLGINPTTNVHYVLSQEVTGFKKLPHHEQSKFASGDYSGLGQVMLLSMFLEEIDLKNGNVGLNALNQVIKIDGDWCFSEFKRINDKSEFSRRDFSITNEAINMLPYPSGFYAHNWFDLVSETVKHSRSTIVPMNRTSSPAIQNEINQCMYKIFLLPDQLIKKLVDLYLPAGGERYINMILNRRETLRKCALNNPEFIKYLNNMTTTENDRNDFLTHLSTFTFEETPSVELTTQVKIEFYINELACSTHPLTRDCTTLLHRILTYRSSTDDVQMDHYMLEKIRKIRKHNDAYNGDKLTVLKNALQTTVNDLSANTAFRLIKGLRMPDPMTKQPIPENISEAIRLENELKQRPPNERLNITTPMPLIQDQLHRLKMTLSVKGLQYLDTLSQQRIGDPNIDASIQQYIDQRKNDLKDPSSTYESMYQLTVELAEMINQLQFPQVTAYKKLAHTLEIGRNELPHESLILYKKAIQDMCAQQTHERFPMPTTSNSETLLLKVISELTTKGLSQLTKIMSDNKRVNALITQYKRIITERLTSKPSSAENSLRMLDEIHQLKPVLQGIEENLKNAHDESDQQTILAMGKRIIQTLLDYSPTPNQQPIAPKTIIYNAIELEASLLQKECNQSIDKIKALAPRSFLTLIETSIAPFHKAANNQANTIQDWLTLKNTLKTTLNNTATFTDIINLANELSIEIKAFNVQTVNNLDQSNTFNWLRFKVEETLSAQCLQLLSEIKKQPVKNTAKATPNTQDIPAAQLSSAGESRAIVHQSIIKRGMTAVRLPTKTLDSYHQELEANQFNYRGLLALKAELVLIRPKVMPSNTSSTTTGATMIMDPSAHAPATTPFQSKR